MVLLASSVRLMKVRLSEMPSGCFLTNAHEDWMTTCGRLRRGLRANASTVVNKPNKRGQNNISSHYKPTFAYKCVQTFDDCL